MKEKKGGKLKWIILIVIAVIILGTIFGGDSTDEDGSSSAKSDTKTEQEITYKKVSAKELSEALSKNAAKASKEYKDQYLEITGELSVIDSQMSYISISSGELDLTNIQCYIQNEDQEEKILEMEQGDEITVKGKCTDVGEVLGYTIDMESVE